MDKEIIKIDFNAKIKPVKPINEQFTLCKCYVMALGKNNNQTIISKESVEDALPTLYNVPVVGHLYADEDGVIRMGGHDIVVEKNEKGDYLFKSITVPYGTVPQQEGVSFETVDEGGGVSNTYMVADIILWTGRYPELLDAIYSEDIYFAQSMEILPSETKRTPDGLEINKFQFSALCLLGKSDDKGKNVVPCFKAARVEPYKFSETGKWTELFAEFKDQLAKSYSLENVGEGGNKLKAEIIKQILSEFGLSEATALPFSISDEMTEENLREKLAQTFQKQDEEPVSEPEDKEGEEAVAEEEKLEEDVAPADEEPEGDGTSAEEKADADEADPEDPEEKVASFAAAATYKERWDLLNEALMGRSVFDDDVYDAYYLMDFDEAYVYACHESSYDKKAYDRETVRIPYSIVDGKISIDLEARRVVRQVWLTKEEEDKLAAEQAEYAELKAYKADRIEKDKMAAFAAVIAEFSDLGEVDEYKTIVKDAMTFESVEALTEKLYAIRGKHAIRAPKKPLEQIRIPVGFELKNKQSEYDEFMSRYLAPAK